MTSSNSELKNRRRNRLIIIDYSSYIRLWLVDFYTHSLIHYCYCPLGFTGEQFIPKKSLRKCSNRLINILPTENDWIRFLILFFPKKHLYTLYFFKWLLKSYKHFLFKKSKFRLKILKKLRKFNWIKMNIFLSVRFFFKTIVFEIKKCQNLKNNYLYDFFFRKLIIQWMQIKKENIRLILNFILFWSVIDSENIIIMKARHVSDLDAASTWVSLFSYNMFLFGFGFEIFGL